MKNITVKMLVTYLFIIDYRDTKPLDFSWQKIINRTINIS